MAFFCCSYSQRNVIQWKTLNVINLGQTEIDNINRTIIISDLLLIRLNWWTIIYSKLFFFCSCNSALWDQRNVIQWKPLNVITLGQTEIDNINRTIIISDLLHDTTCLINSYFRLGQSESIWSHLRNDSDHIKRPSSK